MDNKNYDFTNANNLRQKAEVSLQSKQSQVTGIDKTDVKRLLHELQVHQIELQLQNEELIQANEMAEAALKKYTMLYDFAPMGYFILDSDATICDLNFTGAEILGDKRHSLLDINFRLFVSDESISIFNKFFSNMFSNNIKDSCQLNLGYYKTKLGLVYMEGIVTDDKDQCLLSIINISDIKKNTTKTEKE